MRDARTILSDVGTIPNHSDIPQNRSGITRARSGITRNHPSITHNHSTLKIIQTSLKIVPASLKIVPASLNRSSIQRIAHLLIFFLKHPISACEPFPPQVSVPRTPLPIGPFHRLVGRWRACKPVRENQGKEEPLRPR